MWCVTRAVPAEQSAVSSCGRQRVFPRLVVRRLQSSALPRVSVLLALRTSAAQFHITALGIPASVLSRVNCRSSNEWREVGNYRLLIYGKVPKTCIHQAEKGGKVLRDVLRWLPTLLLGPEKLCFLSLELCDAPLFPYLFLLTSFCGIVYYDNLSVG